MTGEKRRNLIVAALKTTAKPISASAFAADYNVSRQVIVGDVALLRAAGFEVRATSRGYILDQGQEEDIYRGQVVCQHHPQDTKTELALIVASGGKIIDVIVAHPLYGELSGNLDIKNQDDVISFITAMEKESAQLLSALTGGIHIHTLETTNEEEFKKIKASLKAAGFLYHN